MEVNGVTVPASVPFSLTYSFYGHGQFISLILLLFVCGHVLKNKGKKKRTDREQLSSSQLLLFGGGEAKD